MRLDYGLYGIAIICFVIAGIFMASVVPGYTLMEQSGIAVIMIFLLLGIILAAAGYSARPKPAMPAMQPTHAPVTLPKETATQPIVEETPPPPTQTPQEEVKPEPQPPALAEPSPPAAPVSMEAEQPVAAEEEKPKPARRRRKKASA